ncbi:acyl-CoA thioesterase [Streptomyces sp. NPDC087263]|uniref:acyl-CoA thioesterase n=1 Tax=Streptomyces sp. NPDC087263 TaxID=3365773 RepID=UPI00380B8998
MSNQKSHTEIVGIFFDDLDAFGMLYHGRYAAILERGVTTYFTEVGLTYGHEDLNVVVRELAVTFEQSIRGVGPVELTFWIEKLGRTSATFAFRFHSKETEHAHGRRVIVKFDPSTGKPAPWTDSTRSLLEEELLVKQ